MEAITITLTVLALVIVANEIHGCCQLLRRRPLPVRIRRH